MVNRITVTQTVDYSTRGKVYYLCNLIHRNNYDTLQQAIRGNKYKDILYDYDLLLFYNAVVSGNVNCLLVLINDAKISPNLRDKHGNTALHYGKLNTDCARVLLQYINPNTLNSFGYTPLDHATEFDNTDYVSILQKVSKK